MAKQKVKPTEEPKPTDEPKKRMKIVCDRRGLLAAARLVSAVAGRGGIKPVLNNIKAIAAGECLTLMATDLETAIRLDVRGIRVAEPGAGLLPIGKLLAILSETTDEEIHIEAGSDLVLVTGISCQFEMPGWDVGDYPDVPAFDATGYHEITGSVLREMIRRTVFAAASENVRFGATTGVLWELDGDEAVLVATDGRRLALVKGPAKAHNGHKSERPSKEKPTAYFPVVPAKAMVLLARNLTDPDEVVRVAFRENEVLFQTAQAMIYSRLVEGRFPDYQQVIPKSANQTVPLTAGPLLSSIHQATIMCDENVRLNFTKNKLTLACKGEESGQSHVELPIDYDGKAAQIAFNPTHVTDMLRVLEPDAALALGLAGDKPAVFRHDPSYVYVTVPMVAAAKA